MKSNNLNKEKRFLLPILLVVLISLLLTVSVTTYLNINIFKEHIKNDIKKYKTEYLQKHKNTVYKNVHLVNGSIQFQITKIEKKLQKSLSERIQTALKIAQYVYDKQKGKVSSEEIKKRIADHLSAISFNEGRGYYFVYKNDTNIILTHALEDFIGKDMTNFKDYQNQNLVSLYREGLSKDKISFSKIYFRKPSDQNIEYPKIVAVANFEPLNITIGTGEYLDVVEDQIKSYVIERFENITNGKNNYLFFLDIHNINGGEKFATFLLNSNKPEIVGTTIDDSVKDEKGKFYMKEFLSSLKKDGEAFVKYWYKKPNINESKPKLSYIYLQKDWNWIIGSGFYYDDLEKKIANMELTLHAHTKDVINKAFIWIIVLSFIIILIAILVSIRIDKTIKQYTDEIVQKKFELELAQEVAKIGSWSLNLKTNEVAWSDEMYNIFEIDKEKLKPSYEVFLSRVHPEDRAKVNDNYIKSLKDKQTYHIVHRLLMDEGRIKWIDEKGQTVFDENNQAIISSGTARDITKEYEQQENSKMQEKILYEQEKLASMGEMIGNIAHQWRQPLSVISTSTSGMQIEKEMNTLSDEKFDNYTNGILKNTDFLSNTIDTFRNYIKEKKEKKEVILQDRIYNAVSIVESTLKNNHIEMINNIDKCEPIAITMVVGELSQVLINLVSNAKDVLIQNDIENKVLKIDLRKEDDKAIITVEDNGGGIEADILPKIFNPYFSTKHQSQGTGLGLHMSKEIVEKHLNGTLSARNGKDGAIFIIELPLV